MYHVATRRDLDDPATIEEFCRERARARGAARPLPPHRRGPLDHLAHRDDVVEGAHARRAVLRGRGASRRAKAARATREPRGPGSRGRLRALVAGTDAGALEAFLAIDARAVPARQSRRSRSSQHARASRARRGGGPRARVPSRHPEAAELCVVADDRPGLLARIAAAITAKPARGPRRPGLLAPRVDGEPRGRRPLLGARPRRGHRGRGARAAAARARSSKTSARDAIDAAELLRAADRLDVAVARASQPRGADRDLVRRPRVAAPHGRRGVRQGPPGIALHGRSRAPRARASRSRCRRSTPRGRASPTSST